VKKVKQKIDYSQYPDAKGHFGIFGGRFVSETLMAAVIELEKSYKQLKKRSGFSGRI